MEIHPGLRIRTILARIVQATIIWLYETYLRMYGFHRTKFLLIGHACLLSLATNGFMVAKSTSTITSRPRHQDVAAWLPAECQGVATDITDLSDSGPLSGLSFQRIFPKFNPRANARIRRLVVGSNPPGKGVDADTSV